MIAEHDDAARASGARIVHLCGHDSVPWDLSTLMLAKALKAGERGGQNGGEELQRVDFFTDIRSAPSGGTLETALGILFGEEGKAETPAAVKALGFDPLVKGRPRNGSSGGGASVSKTSARNVKALARGTASQMSHPLTKKRPHRALFVMADVNANVGFSCICGLYIIRCDICASVCCVTFSYVFNYVFTNCCVFLPIFFLHAGSEEIECSIELWKEGDVLRRALLRFLFWCARELSRAIVRRCNVIYSTTALLDAHIRAAEAWRRTFRRISSQRISDCDRHCPWQ